jgi:hypothetical protein
MALRHDCFIVYHPADKPLVDAFIERFRDVFIPRARGITDADGLSAAADSDRDRLLRQIRERFIWTATLTIVLTGPCTWASRHVDWAIAAALTADPLRARAAIGDPGGRATGLLGIRLRNLPAAVPAVVPERFADNVDAGYAMFRGDPASSEELRSWVEAALVRAQYGTPDNARPLRTEDGACP